MNLCNDQGEPTATLCCLISAGYHLDAPNVVTFYHGVSFFAQIT